MKQVILPSKKSVVTVHPNKCKVNKFYGVRHEHDPDAKYFITRTNSGNFALMGGAFLTTGNHHLSFPGQLEQRLTTLLQNGSMVYEFDTCRELYQWLAADQ
jgi:hypothetical protein